MTLVTIPIHRIETLREIVRRTHLDPAADFADDEMHLVPVLTDEQLDDLLDILDGIIEERHG